MALTRQKLSVLDRSRLGPAAGLRRGGYILREASGEPKVILIGTGSEVHLALSAAERLEAENLSARVVSLPSWELFEAQPADYRASVLPPAIRARVTIEAASPMGWLRYATDDGEIIGLDHFGASAPGGVLMEKMGLTVERVVEAAKRVAAARGRR
jgi:transketolase